MGQWGSLASATRRPTLKVAMADRVSSFVRSKIMKSVRTRDTGPELFLRKALHRLGFRFRVHVRLLPGKPDLVFPARKAVIFVHGCFWHGHACRWGRLPKSRPQYWGPKIQTNRSRDARALRKLRRTGWRALVVWECQLRDLESSLPRILKFLKRPQRKTH